MKDPQLSGIAKALAAHGRKGDTELVHVSKKELETLEKYGEGLGIHLTKNPTTGLPEAFNWGGMAGSIALPLLLTVATGGAAAPWMLAAAGAAGGAGGTMLGGGTTDEALISGVMGGIGGYGMGSMAGNLAQAGVEQAGTEAVKQGAIQSVEQAAANTASSGATGLLGSGGSSIAGIGANAASPIAGTASTALPGAMSPLATGAAGTGSSGLLGASGSAISGIGTNAAAPMIGTSSVALPGAAAPITPAAVPLQAPPTTGLQNMQAGLNAITSSPSAFGNFAMNNASNIGMTGIGIAGVGSALNPQETGITTEPESTGNPYTAEWYTDPATGQQRTRAVRRAEGGMTFSDYDAAEAGPNGGYAPGGGVNFAAGGLGSLGSYSDGGRMLKGPGDGVSDSIPASIEGKRPARLADGEFVIPSRIVSELGNGSSEAGSRALYKMMDRIQARRRKTVGKNGIAVDSKARNELPA